MKPSSKIRGEMPYARPEFDSPHKKAWRERHRVTFENHPDPQPFEEFYAEQFDELGQLRMPPEPTPEEAASIRAQWAMRSYTKPTPADALMAALAIGDPAPPDHEMKWPDLLAFDPTNDPDCLMGNRYLGRSGGLVVVGPSGIGKSVAALQLGSCATLGKPFLGLAMQDKLRVVYIQAEDDLGDVAEAVQGFVKGYTLTPDELAELQTNLRILRWNDCAGGKFLLRLREELTARPADLVIVNPLFSFLGCPVSDQAEMSAFLRNGLNPILNETRAACAFIHHSNKPTADPKQDTSGLAEFQSYLGSGSAELTNWARAYITLQAIAASKGKAYKMTFAKRGKRAGIVDAEGKPTDSVTLAHSPHGLCWVASDYSPAKNPGGKFTATFNLENARMMYDSAKDWPENEKAIATAQGMTPRAVRNHRERILEAV